MTNASPRCLIVVPTLNEERFIGPLLDQLLTEASLVDALVVIADGGSTDRTRAIVSSRAATEPTLRLLANPARIQSAGINRAVEAYGKDTLFLIRIDAHAGYPDDYCQALVAEAHATDASSVVVAMRTVGERGFQAAAAAAQSGLIGTGGSAHRMNATGRWVDHGHHALMRTDAFRAVGGYDEDFTHNEDAELDHRLRAAGHRIWMTATTQMTYYPRASPGALFRQYFGYGRGRARNLLKHRVVPKLRQTLPMVVAPALLAACLAPLFPFLAVPALLWLFGCLGAGAFGFVRSGRASAFLAAIAAMVMHVGWSLGFWTQVARGPWQRAEAA